MSVLPLGLGYSTVAMETFRPAIVLHTYSIFQFILCHYLILKQSVMPPHVPTPLHEIPTLLGMLAFSGLPGTEYMPHHYKLTGQEGSICCIN